MQRRIRSGFVLTILEPVAKRNQSLGEMHPLGQGKRDEGPAKLLFRDLRVGIGGERVSEKGFARACLATGACRAIRFWPKAKYAVNM